MADRILKPDSGNDLILQNDDASGKIEITDGASIPVTGTFDVSSATLTTSSAQKEAIVQAGPGSGTLDVSSGTFTTSSAQKQAIVQAGPGSGTFDVSSGTFTTSTAQKQAISATAFASGTKMIFQQTSAPTGWTKVTSSNDVALRVVSGTVGSGGTVAFETAFASQTPSQASGASVSNHTLTRGEMAAHTHNLRGYSSGSIGGNSNMVFGNESGGFGSCNAGGVHDQTGGSTNTDPVGNGAHNHNMTQATYNAIDLDVSYVDVIIATKD